MIVAFLISTHKEVNKKILLHIIKWMKLSFQKKTGIPELGILFFWCLKIPNHSTKTHIDRFIPELFYDYFYVKQGNMKIIDSNGEKSTLPKQSLKMIYTKPLHFAFSSPLVLYGARLSLQFAEMFWDKVKANDMLNQIWIKQEANSLKSFEEQVSHYIKTNQKRHNAYPMFKSGILSESDWLVNFSSRHKRRLYQATFGVSRKELQNIYNLQSFLEQICSFDSENPRIIRHVNPEAFYDQPHLNHTFKKVTGLSPVEYFETNSILQDNLMSASYNVISSV